MKTNQTLEALPLETGSGSFPLNWVHVVMCSWGAHQKAPSWHVHRLGDSLWSHLVSSCPAFTGRPLWQRFGHLLAGRILMVSSSHLGLETIIQAGSTNCDDSSEGGTSCGGSATSFSLPLSFPKVSTSLKNIGHLGLVFPKFGKISKYDVCSKPPSRSLINQGY